MRLGVSAGRATQAEGRWKIWVQFREQYFLAPYFTPDPEEDPVPWLQVFAQQFRDGRLAPHGNGIRHQTVEDALRFVAQAHTMLGHTDPRKTFLGETDPRLARQLKGYKRADPPPTRVKPIPIGIRYSAWEIA